MRLNSTHLSRRGSEHVQNSATDKNSFFNQFFSAFLSRKSDHSASGAMITLTIRLNSTQLPVELS